MKQKTVEELVLQTLEERELSRGDDFRLYAGVLKRMGVDLNMSLMQFFAWAKEHNCPALESVPRARRKIFEERPELQPLEIKLKREEKEREFIKYSRGEN